MAAEPTPISVPADSELGRLLDDAVKHNRVLEANGVRYRVIRDDISIWSDYDPDAVSEAVAATAGTWSDVNPDELSAALYRARDAGSRPATRP